MDIQYAPLALFVYNRPWHLQETVEALKKNELARNTELIIFSDGAKDDTVKNSVENVRQYVKDINGFKSVNVILRETNLGLAKSIVSGVTETVKKYGRIIVMEDDLVSSPFFLKFMNDALDFYKNEKSVISIHGYSYPVAPVLPDTFFLKDPGCLGWATWQRGWAIFENDGKKLLAELESRNLAKEFNYDSGYGYTNMLRRQIGGKGESWAILWYASAFLNNKLSLYPGRSLIRHIGNDGSGTNFGMSDILDTKITDSPINVRKINVVEDVQVRRQIGRYLSDMRPSLLRRIENKIARLVTKGKI